MGRILSGQKSKTVLSVTIQEVTKNLSFIILSLLAFRGMIEFFEASQHSAIRSVVTFFTEPLVRPFYGLFSPNEEAVSLAIFAAMLSICVLSGICYIAAGSIHRIEEIKPAKAQKDLQKFKQKKTA